MKCAACGVDVGTAEGATDFPALLVFVGWSICVCSPQCAFDAGCRISELHAEAHRRPPHPCPVCGLTLVFDGPIGRCPRGHDL